MRDWPGGGDIPTDKSDFFEQVLCPCEIENTGIRRILQYTHIISIKRHFSLANTDEKVTHKENCKILPNSPRWTIAVATVQRVIVQLEEIFLQIRKTVNYYRTAHGA